MVGWWRGEHISGGHMIRLKNGWNDKIKHL